MKKNIKKIYITGGGCFGKQYSEGLLLAQKQGKLSFDQIICIDQNADCQVAGEIDHPQVKVQEGQWYDYFSDYLVNHHMSASSNQDHWVPSHVAPHIMFYSFQKALVKLGVLGARIFQEIPFSKPIGSPVDILFPNGSKAVSYAEWECPIACVEPKTCPAINKKRTWEVQERLEKFSEINVIRCQHLSHAVSTVPFKEVLTAFTAVLTKIKSGENRFSLATVSSCHGLISSAELVKTLK